MKWNVVMLALVLAIGIAVGLVGCQGAKAPQEPLTIKELHKTDIKGTGKELTVFTVEVAPGAAIPKHYHPGYEFAYVLEGSGFLEWEQGKPKLATKPGVYVNDYSSPEKAEYTHWGANTSKKDPQKWLLVLVTDKGQPPLIPVK